MLANANAAPALIPFAFRTRDGYLVGLAADPSSASPCAECVALWLKDRNVWIDKIPLHEIPVRRDVIANMLSENQPHVFYEITNEGASARLDSMVFPHPQCGCDRGQYIAYSLKKAGVNYAFSPILQLNSIRFGTSSGNLWVTVAVGEAPMSAVKISVTGSGITRELSRQSAVDEWLKKASVSDLSIRLSQHNEALPCQVLQTGHREIYHPARLAGNSASDIVGAGATEKEASLDALYELAKVSTLSRYASQMKSPMLVVGTNNWLRAKLPFTMLQQYDMYVLFYPNSMPAWVVGIAALSRLKIEQAPIFVFGSHAVIEKALDGALLKLLEICRPGVNSSALQSSAMATTTKAGQKAPQLLKLNMWWTHWLYRCPKINLQDVVHLEAYSEDIELWRNFFRDGQPTLRLIPINYDCLPTGIRTLVKLEAEKDLASRKSSNVHGIGSLAAFRMMGEG